VKAIRNLDCARCSGRDVVADALTAIIARDDRCPRMLAQPRRQRGGLIVGQDVNRSAHCQIDQQQAVVLWSTERELIDAQFRWRRTHRELLMAQQPTQCIWAGG
jgi:hypothetical protein